MGYQSLDIKNLPLAVTVDPARHWDFLGVFSLSKCLLLLAFTMAFLCGTFLSGTLLPGSLARADTTLSNFNNNWDFGWDFEGFSSTPGTTANRIEDPVDGWGGSGRWLGSSNLSGEANNHLTVDLTANAANEVDSFVIQMVDTAGVHAVWEFDASKLVAGVPTQLVSSAPMSSPHYGDNGHGGSEHYKDFDLTQVQSWQVLGEWGSPYPVDLSFDNVAISSSATPPEYYAGHSAGAAWRGEAATRIDAVRKADLQVNVTDAVGNPLPNATIAVAMQEHEFRFGSKVPLSALNGSGSLNTTYKQKVLELFNTAQPQDFGWQAWEGETHPSNSQANTVSGLNWVEANGLDAYGHVYVWPGNGHVPNAVQAKMDEYNLAGTSAARKTQLQGELAQDVLDHIVDKGPQIAGKVDWMNVVNELRNNRDLVDILGDGAVKDWFVAARAVDPNIGLHINEQHILVSSGGTDTSNQQGYYDWIESLQSDGAPITGVGMQSHFTAGRLTGPEEVWAILDRYNGLGLDMAVTEFDFDTVDEQLQADFTRDFLTAIFAHEGMDAFLMWDFSEWFHWRRDAAMFDFSWNIKPNGQAYVDLVLNDWWTEEQLTSDASGEALLRAFKGEYEITVTLNGEEITVPVTLTDGGLVLDIALPLLATDFDGDGDVDADDLAEWLSNFGSANPSAGDADFDGDVDGSDFLSWQRDLGQSLPPAGATSIPEPSTVALLLLGCGLGSVLVHRRG